MNPKDFRYFLRVGEPECLAKKEITCYDNARRCTNMKKISTGKLKRLRDELHLNREYLAELLGITEEEYLLVECNKTSVTSTQLETLCKVYGVSEEYLYNDDARSNVVLARTEGQLSEKDEKQIAEFFNFQRYSGKKRSKELVHH